MLLVELFLRVEHLYGPHHAVLVWRRHARLGHLGQQAAAVGPRGGGALAGVDLPVGQAVAGAGALRHHGAAEVARVRVRLARVRVQVEGGLELLLALRVAAVQGRVLPGCGRDGAPQRGRGQRPPAFALHCIHGAVCGAEQGGLGVVGGLDALLRHQGVEVVQDEADAARERAGVGGRG